MKATHFAVNVLSEDQTDLSRVFATKEARPWEKLEHTPAEQTGSPLFRGCCAYMECAMETIHDGGDHDIFIGEIVAGELNSGDPLLYFAGKYRDVAPLEE